MGRDASMADPFTLAAVGAVAITEGIKFLYGQAGDVIKWWHQRKAAGKSASAEPVDSPTGRSSDLSRTLKTYERQ